MARTGVFILLAAAVSAAPAQARGFDVGQWQINGTLATQQICIEYLGTWYGTTFNWSGLWRYPIKGYGQLNGNYAVGNEPFGYGNSSLEFTSLGGGKEGVLWYDWFDDSSYTHYELAPIVFVKADCDPPYTGANTQAASQ